MKDEFHFRQFTIRQDKTAMKVGTDGVLLGAWAWLPPQGRVLDIGTGTGLIALMAAQRSDCEITALEVEDGAVEQARENVAASAWHDRIRILHQNAATYVPDVPFDAILSNPPFYDNRLAPPDDARRMARHASSLSLEVLARNAARWLAPEGKLQVVLPLPEAERFCDACAGVGLFPERRMVVVTREPKAPRRVLLACSRLNGPTCEEKLVLSDGDGRRTEAYRELTRDFYLPEEE